MQSGVFTVNFLWKHPPHQAILSHGTSTSQLACTLFSKFDPLQRYSGATSHTRLFDSEISQNQSASSSLPELVRKIISWHVHLDWLVENVSFLVVTCVESSQLAIQVLTRLRLEVLTNLHLLLPVLSWNQLESCFACKDEPQSVVNVHNVRVSHCYTLGSKIQRLVCTYAAPWLSGFKPVTSCSIFQSSTFLNSSFKPANSISLAPILASISFFDLPFVI